MSYILDALTQADRKRRRAQVPTIESVHQTDPPTGAVTVPWRVVLVLAAATALATAGYLALRSTDPGATASRPEPTVSESAIRANSNPPTERKRENGREPPTSEENTAKLANDAVANTALPRPASQNSAEFGSLASPGEKSLAPGDGVRGRDRPPPGLNTSALRAPPPAATVEEDAHTQQEKRIVVAAEDSPQAAIPLLEELPADFRDALPPISINAHVYTEDPAERMVIINMRRYREGDNTAEGITIKQIGEKGVTAAYAQQRFRLQR